jgi:serine protease AprX
VTPDGVAHVQSLGYDPGSQPGSTVNVTRLTGAQAAWRRGITGAGVDVAVIDTGTTPVPSLRDAGKVVVGPDLSFDSQADNLRYLDGFGHGTHMASLIAGREVPPGSGAAYAEDTRNLYGMAPDARLVSIKVGDARGAVDVSQLVAAVDWVVQNRASGGLNIRVLNLSFGTDSTQSALLDPLSYAAEVAWRKGIVVVASAGNDGGAAAGLADPAYNGSILAVGAVDTQGTDSMADDAVPAFSQRPRNALYQRSPDLVAPGVGIVAAGVPGGYLWTAHPGARLGADQFRGSGTSQSAAVVSGAAALLLQRWPTLTPDALKELLTRTATPLRNATSAAQGNGELNVASALATWPLTLGVHVGYFGYFGGSADRHRHARGCARVEAPGHGRRRAHRRARRHGRPMDALARRTPHPRRADVVRRRLVQRQPGGRATASPATTSPVAGRTWGGRSWAGRSWAGSSWSGSAWAGRSWADAAWDGRSWAGQAWMDSAAGEPAPRQRCRNRRRHNRQCLK